MSSFSVSVIVPVFNSAPFLERAVESCVHLQEVEEVLLIEDGSEDNSLAICEHLSENFDKVKLLRHEGGLNRGPGVTRNLGLTHASREYIAFLDSDDYYLPNRFEGEAERFEDDSIDAVHKVIAVAYESDEMKAQHLSRMKAAKRDISNRRLPLDYTGVEEVVHAEDLFGHLIKTTQGWIHLNALTIRKTALTGFEGFNENYLGQDAEFIKRLAAERVLVNGISFEPVAVRYVHAGNRILNKKIVKAKPRKKIGFAYWLLYCLRVEIHKRDIYHCLLKISTYGYPKLYQKAWVYFYNSVILQLMKFGMIEREASKFLAKD